MQAFGDMVTIGRVVKPQGRRGEVLTEPVSDRPERFPGLRRAFLPAPGGRAREVKVLSCWPHKGRFVLKIQGVDSIDDAERLRGLDIRIGEDELSKLPSGSYYHHELLGLEVRDPVGDLIGRVESILETGGVPVLVVVNGRGETLIPLAGAFVQGVDVAGGRIVARVPEYENAAAGVSRDGSGRPGRRPAWSPRGV
jgi:16S rRNA processing protein RimM